MIRLRYRLVHLAHHSTRTSCSVHFDCDATDLGPPSKNQSGRRTQSYPLNLLAPGITMVALAPMSEAWQRITAGPS